MSMEWLLLILIGVGIISLVLANIWYLEWHFSKRGFVFFIILVVLVSMAATVYFSIPHEIIYFLLAAYMVFFIFYVFIMRKLRRVAYGR